LFRHTIKTLEHGGFTNFKYSSHSSMLLRSAKIS
jgi:hypothetical protein